MSASELNTEPAAGEQALSVAELTSQVKELLEMGFPGVWVCGEISNFSQPGSGHCYFTLKDDEAQIRAVVWRNTAARLSTPLADGMEILCFGRLEVYAPRGTYQIVIERVRPVGLGALEQRLRRLRDKLAAEGLFAPERKRPLPAFPRRIGFVTSPTGAAVRDFLEVLRRRWHGVEVVIIPCRVQGDSAAGEIAAGIERANALPLNLDVLVVGRGGGSLEDLWAFNEEVVVRAIAASAVPTISAVGHEIDITLADLVADVRALTPSEAAERVLPAADEVRGFVRGIHQRMLAALRSRLHRAKQSVDGLAMRRAFRKPHDRIHDLERRLDELEARSSRAMRHRLTTARNRIERLAGKLESLSPLGVLARGYSVTQRLPGGELVRDAAELKPGDRLQTRLNRGRVVSTVDQVQPDQAPPAEAPSGDPNPGTSAGATP